MAGCTVTSKPPYCQNMHRACARHRRQRILRCVRLQRWRGSRNIAAPSPRHEWCRLRCGHFGNRHIRVELPRLRTCRRMHPHSAMQCRGRPDLFAEGKSAQKRCDQVKRRSRQESSLLPELGNHAAMARRPCSCARLRRNFQIPYANPATVMTRNVTRIGVDHLSSVADQRRIMRRP